MNSRYDTQVVGYGSFEFDHADRSLRLSWPGEQMFLSSIEATGLHDFLNQVMPRTRPKIVTLCGSTRFYETFERANLTETLNGNIVLSIGVNAHDDDLDITPEEKAALDELHLQKIAISDEILVLNVGGYIGESTRREIEYARAHGKRIRWWEEPDLHQITDSMRTPSLAQGTCPKCGLDRTAHSAWIANPGDTTCEEVEEL